jgi:hypothetical protein
MTVLLHASRISDPVLLTLNSPPTGRVSPLNASGTSMELTIAINRYDRHVPFFNGTVDAPKGVTKWARARSTATAPTGTSG